MKKIHFFIAFLIVFIVFSAGCTQNTQGPVPATTPGAAPGVPPISADTVKTVASPLGTILTDARGLTLYFFADDIPGTGISTCYGPCAKAWPIFFVDSPTVSPPLAGSDFDTITRTDGTKQTSYKGWPLYYFIRDKNAGETTGENVQGNWSVAKPDYTVMYSEQPGFKTFLTDGSGRTLYFFARENPGEVACTGACLANWPAFSSGPLVAPSLMKAADFSTTTRPDGARQSLYKGRLLYYYAGDIKPGEMNGQGALNAWYVADINGNVPVPAATATTLPTTMPTTDYSTRYSGMSSGY